MSLTNEEVGIGRGGAILFLQELVEEGGETGYDRGEAALSQNQENEEGVEEQLEKDPREFYKGTRRKK